MKVHINSDELYPYSYMDNTRYMKMYEVRGKFVEISEEEYKQYCTFMESFWKWQKRLDELLLKQPV